MSCITKCQRFKGRFSEIDVWSPIITKRVVSRPIIAIFSKFGVASKQLMECDGDQVVLWFTRKKVDLYEEDVSVYVDGCSFALQDATLTGKLVSGCRFC